MMENVAEYMNFFPTERVLDEELLLQKVVSLQNNGQWSMDIADGLPLAVANCFDLHLMIFSSKRGTPIIDIYPTILAAESTSDKPTIKIAYRSHRGLEHYDGVKQVVLSSQNQNTPNKSRSRKPANETTRKQATFISPQKGPKSRKGTAKMANWKRNVRKTLRLQGKEYLDYKGKTVAERSMKSQDCSKCRLKCSELVSEDERDKLFTEYWNLNSYERQRDFICSSITEHLPKRMLRQAQKPKTLSREYHFQVNGVRIRVCKTFFIRTLDVGETTVTYAMKNKGGQTCGTSDNRGGKSPHSKTPVQTVEDIKRHTESMPIVEAHYTRKDTNRQFLGQDLPINKMYDLYKEQCINARKRPASLYMYRKTFCENYNLSFHTPNNDMCSLCNKINQLKDMGTPDEEPKLKHQEHIKNKERAREEKPTFSCYNL
jgi:hypothetical protein